MGHRTERRALAQPCSLTFRGALLALPRAEQTLKEMRAESRRIAWLALVIVLLVVAAWFIADPDLAYRFFTGFSLPEFESDPAADGVAPPGAMPTGRFGGGGGGGAGGGHLHDDDDWLLDH